MTQLHSYEYTRKRNMKRGRIRCALFGLALGVLSSSMTYYIVVKDDCKAQGVEEYNLSLMEELSETFVNQITKSTTPPPPPPKPVWIVERAEFQAQLEEALED